MATASGFSFPLPCLGGCRFRAVISFSLHSALCFVFFCSCQLSLPVVSSLRAPWRFLFSSCVVVALSVLSSSAPFFPSRSPSSSALCLPVQCGPVWLGRFVFPVRPCAWCVLIRPHPCVLHFARLPSLVRAVALLASRFLSPVPSLPALSSCLGSLPRFADVPLGSPTALSVPRRPFVLFGVLYSPLVCSFLGSSA